MTTVASTAETAGAYSLTEHLVTAASNPPMHVQTDEDEAFYILDGKVEFEVDGCVAPAPRAPSPLSPAAPPTPSGCSPKRHGCS